jgi:general nucleoside transport system ATP-binding protein
VDDHPRADRALTDTAGLPLELQGITKQFGGVKALDDVSFRVRRGMIHALLGENGAGKTTLMRIAFGMIDPDAGSIATDGRKRHISSPADAIACGIGMVHQQFSLVPAMTVAENVALGGSGRYSERETALRIAELAEETGLTLDPMERVANLGSADRQKLEIIRTLVHRASVMILDEPTAVLTPADARELFTQIRSFANGGGSVVLITHKLRDAVEHADEVTVLRRGKVVLTSAIRDTSEGLLAEAMLGAAPAREMNDRVASSPAGELIASLKRVRLSSKAGLDALMDLEVRGGEVVGVAALDGAAAPLLRALAGRAGVASGIIDIPSTIGFVPENRQDEGLIADFSLTENLALGNAGRTGGLIDWSDMERQTALVIEAFSVRAAGTAASPRHLSGGNQQRFVLGRELRNNPQLLVLENPTQGLDISAAAFVHDRIREARDNGTAVVFYSSDLDEIVSLSDRVVVVSRDGIVSVTSDRSEIGRVLIGSTKREADVS